MSFLEIKAAVAILLVVIAGLGLYRVRSQMRSDDVAECKLEVSQANSKFQAQAQVQTEAYNASVQQATADSNKRLVALASSVAPVGVALDGLRQRYNAALGQRCSVSSTPALPASGASSYATPDLSADLPDRIGTALEQLATYAEQVSIARDECQASWPENHAK